MVYYPQESFPTYFFPNSPNDWEVQEWAREILATDTDNDYLTPDEWREAVEMAMMEREREYVYSLGRLARNLNLELDFHEIIAVEEDGGWVLDVVVKGLGNPYDEYSTDGQVMLATNRMVSKNGNRYHDWPVNRLMGAVQKEEERIRDWLYEVPGQYGFKLISYQQGNNEYSSFRAMSFGRKPKMSRRL